MTKTIGIGAYMKQSREKAGLTRKQAGERIALHPKSIESYEYNKNRPSPDIVLGMEAAYRDPGLTQRYCKTLCAIGSAYNYVVLNNVSLDIPSILLKMRQEYQEAGVALEKLFCLAINKEYIEDFAGHEIREVNSCLQDLQDLEHSIEILKVQLSNKNWFCLRTLVSEHNSKCYKKGYVVDEQGLIKEEGAEYKSAAPGEKKKGNLSHSRWLKKRPCNSANHNEEKRQYAAYSAL